jgi:hypothetical protein
MKLNCSTQNIHHLVCTAPQSFHQTSSSSADSRSVVMPSATNTLERLLVDFGFGMSLEGLVLRCGVILTWFGERGEHFW